MISSELIEEKYSTSKLWNPEEDGSWLIEDYSKLQLNFKYISQQKILSDETVLVENDEQATKALENIVKIKQAELERNYAIRQEYISNNPGKHSPTNVLYSESLRNRFNSCVRHLLRKSTSGPSGTRLFRIDNHLQLLEKQKKVKKNCKKLMFLR